MCGATVSETCNIISSARLVCMADIGKNFKPIWGLWRIMRSKVYRNICAQHIFSICNIFNMQYFQYATFCWCRPRKLTVKGIHVNTTITETVVQEPGRSMGPPPGGKQDSVFFEKVIGCPDHSRMPKSISGELFHLRVEKVYIYISK